LDNSLALRAANRQLEIARAEIERQRGGHYPVLGLKAEHGVQDDDGGFNEGKSGDTVIGLELKLPLYSGGGVSSRTAQAKANYEQALQQVELQRRETIRQTRAAYLNAIAGLSRIKALKQALISTETAHETTEAGFEVGTRTAVDVLLALRETFRAKQDYARARYDYILQTFRLKQAAGILSEEDARKINNWL
ncbi:MAG TPA: type I secretion protein TolC, partial [Gammaproteobacteria bacterium]|nr:type I secretion protein TolC [Gammaproteobacteria bacterium]